MALFHVASQPEMDKNLSIYAQERFTREQKWDEGIKIFLLYVKKNKLECPPHLLVQNLSIKNTILLGVGSCFYLPHPLLIREP